MRKTDKKIDNQLREALTEVCETALKEFSGFQWLTHLVNYSKFPQSLKIICIFDTNDNLDRFMTMNNSEDLTSLMQSKLAEIDIGINLKSMSNYISYDTEEECAKKHNGKWALRLRR